MKSNMKQSNVREKKVLLLWFIQEMRLFSNTSKLRQFTKRKKFHYQFKTGMKLNRRQDVVTKKEYKYYTYIKNKNRA